MGSFVKLNGSVAPNTHNVGDRISWNLRAPVSSKLNRVTLTDGSVTDIPGEIALRPGQKAKAKTYVREGDKLNVLATVKLNSSTKIVGHGTQSGENSVYYIISSEPALKLIKSKWK